MKKVLIPRGEIEKALEILKINSKATPEEIKKAYQKACSYHHPDKPGGCTKIMQAINKAYDTLKKFKEYIKTNIDKYDDVLNEKLTEIIELTEISIEICGTWIWVTGKTWQHKEKLGKKGAGFCWNTKKKAWSFHPEPWKRRNKKSWSLKEIRAQYGSKTVETKSKKMINQ